MLRQTSRSFLYIVIIVLTFIITFALPLGSPGQEGKEDLQACCFPDGSCENLDPDSCYDRGGTPQGYGTTCDSDLCSQLTQACCFPDGSCQDLDPEVCASEGGEPQGEGTDCSPNPCPQPTQACCFPDGSCQDLQVGTCLDMGGTAQGEGTLCHSTNCPQPTQACCLPDGSCEDLEVSACLAADGTPQGEDSFCLGMPVGCPQPTEACCFSDGSCSNLDVESCTSQGGTPQGEGTDCSPNPCPQPTQACCFTDGSCSNLDVESCASQGGDPQGSGTDCAHTSCPQPTQACCFSDGSCSNLDVGSCASQGGEPQGEGTDCSPNPCPQPTQACCFSDGSCQDLQVGVCRNTSGVAQGTGTCCSRTTCPQPEVSAPPLLSIRLISPLPGEGLDLPSTAVQFCWEGLGIAGLTYEVFHHTKKCDPDVVNGPHPFAPLIPDPTLEAEQRARKDSLYREQRTSQQRLDYLAEFCQRHLAQLKKMGEKTNDKSSKLEQLSALKEQLEQGRAAAEEVDYDDAFTPEFADSCSKTLEEILSPYPASFDDLTPCVADACDEFARRLTGITSMLQSLDANATCGSIVFNSLLERWETGTKHRTTFKFYYDLYSGIAGSIAFITDILGNLTPDAEREIMGQINQFLSKLDPSTRAAIETAKTVRNKLEMIQSLLAKGGPSPAFLVEMVKAMAEQAAAAAAVAVKGWARFAQAMASAFDKAYQSVLCDLKVLEWLISQQARIQAFCEACQHCLRDEITAIDAELEEIAAEEQAAVTARQTYWQEQQLVISAQISQVRLTNAWLDACCRPGIQTIQIPSATPCAEKLEDALKEALGDKACFLTFSCTIECKYENGQPVEATVECEHSFPLAERRVCCCVPCERQQSSLGSQPDPGRPGETICHPPKGGVTVPGPGGWGVEARDESGNLVASSSRRELGRSGITELSPLRPGPIPPGGCLCSISASVNGIPMTPGGFALTMQQGVMVNIDAIGDCRPDPDCGTGVQSISIQPPIMAPAWLPNPIAMIPLPITAPAASVAYDFPDEGTYTITVSQFCRDGQKCSYTFTVDASGPPSPVPRQPRPEEEFEPGYCPSCGSDECIELAYQHIDEPPLLSLFGHTLGLVAPSELNLEATSLCRLDCVVDRNVRWEMSEPDGTFVVQEDVNLYRIEYSFEQIGEYLLCVIETVPCPEAELRFENWWIFEVESSD